MRYFDDDGRPLAGGKLYTFHAGTDTPLETYRDAQQLAVQTNPIVLDDAGYAHAYLVSGKVYDMRLTDANGVQIWFVQGVQTSGSGAASMAGPLILKAVAGPNPLRALGAWQPDWEQVGVLAEVTQAFGTSGGLQALAIGDDVQFDRWGTVDVAKGAKNRPGVFKGNPAPWTENYTDIVVTPIGGSFDSTGELQLTLRYNTLL